MNMHNMIKPLLLAAMLIGFAPFSLAEVTSVKGSASQTQLYANKSNAVTITWHVGVSGSTERISYQADIVNLLPVVNMAGVITPPSEITTENFVFSASQIKAWMNQGYRTLVLRRNFTDLAGSPLGGMNADVRFTLIDSDLSAVREVGSFAIARMQLGFPEQTSLAVVESGEQLIPTLAINYRGTGVLAGRWQIADPASTSGVPVFRNLSLVKYSLAQVQHQRIQGPQLPTRMSGKYLLRFCASRFGQTSAAGQCSDDDLQVNASYQVMSQAASQPIRIAPDNVGISAGTAFNWSAVDGAVVYQLQVLQRNADQEAVFVTGMLLPKDRVKAQFSTLVLEKLSPYKQYIWRLQALDMNGQVIGKSKSASFYLAAGNH